MHGNDNLCLAQKLEIWDNFNLYYPGVKTRKYDFFYSRNKIFGTFNSDVSAYTFWVIL